MKFKLQRVPRGQNSGKGFFISTFRFDLPLAQALEKIALAAGLSMSSVINQVLDNFVESADVPDNIKPVKTAVATAWGRGREESDGDEDEKPAKKMKRKQKLKKVERIKKARRAKKVEDEDDEPVQKRGKKKAAAGVLSKLKKKSVDDEVPDDD